MKKKLTSLWREIAGQSAMIWLWIKNLFFVFLTTKSKMRIFEGYMHYWFAKKYANRRTDMTSGSKVCGRKRHYVIPSGDYSLIVLNRTEINLLKSRRIIKKSANINWLLENAYYITK